MLPLERGDRPAIRCGLRQIEIAFLSRDWIEFRPVLCVDAEPLAVLALCRRFSGSMTQAEFFERYFAQADRILVQCRQRCQILLNQFALPPVPVVLEIHTDKFAQDWQVVFMLRLRKML